MWGRVVFHSLLCPAGVWARPSRNKSVADSVHAPNPLRRIQTGRDDQCWREDCLLGLVRIHSTRDSCRTQGGRSYCCGWGEPIPRPDTASDGAGLLNTIADYWGKLSDHSIK